MREEELFELIKGLLTSGGPVPVVVLLHEVKERAGDSGIVRNKLTVKVSKAKKGLHILDLCWSQPSSNAVEFDRVHGELTGFHDHSEVFDFRDVKLALLKLQVKVEFCHSLENSAGSFSMGDRVRRGNEEVIHIDDQPSFSNHVSEQVIHESLECSRRVAKAKEHNHGFKEPLVHDEGCLPLMTVFDMDIIVSSTNVEFSEVASVFQLVH